MLKYLVDVSSAYEGDNVMPSTITTPSCVYVIAIFISMKCFDLDYNSRRIRILSCNGSPLQKGSKRSKSKAITQGGMHFTTVEGRSKRQGHNHNKK